MKKGNSFFINWLFLALAICQYSVAQESSFYARLNRSVHLESINERQYIPFEENDIIYNNHLIDFSEKQFKITKNGTYEISGFVNINPGIFGEKDDIIAIEVQWLINKDLPNEKILYKTQQHYTKGNLDVSRSFIFPEQLFDLNKDDIVSVGVRVLEESSTEINPSKRYDHIHHPTGFTQIAGIRIHLVDSIH